MPMKRELQPGDRISLDIDAEVVRVNRAQGTTTLNVDDFYFPVTVDTSDLVKNANILVPPMPETLGTILRAKIGGSLFVRVKQGWHRLDSNVIMNADAMRLTWADDGFTIEYQPKEGS